MVDSQMLPKRAAHAAAAEGCGTVKVAEAAAKGQEAVTGGASTRARKARRSSRVTLWDGADGCVYSAQRSWTATLWAAVAAGTWRARSFWRRRNRMRAIDEGIRRLRQFGRVVWSGVGFVEMRADAVPRNWSLRFAGRCSPRSCLGPCGATLGATSEPALSLHHSHDTNRHRILTETIPSRNLILE
jgi:hypothetical protein